MSIHGYSAGDKLIHTEFAWVWFTQTAVLPRRFECWYAAYCKRYELDPEEEGSMDSFIAEHIDEWATSEWEELERDTQDSQWELVE